MSKRVDVHWPSTTYYLQVKFQVQDFSECWENLWLKVALLVSHPVIQLAQFDVPQPQLCSGTSKQGTCVAPYMLAPTTLWPAFIYVYRLVPVVAACLYILERPLSTYGDSS